MARPVNVLPVMPPGYPEYPQPYGYPMPYPFPVMPPTQTGVLPEARGKAAAFDAWLAQGGELPGRESVGRGGRKPGIFTQGPMKGMTYDQAKQKFESMWAGADDSIKDKYARKSSNDLAPVERPGGNMPTGNAANGTRPGETMPQYYQRIGMAPKPAPAAAKKSTLPTEAPAQASVPSFEDLTMSPEQQAALTPDGQRHAIGSGEASAPIVSPVSPWNTAFGADAMNPFAAIDANPYAQQQAEELKAKALEQEAKQRQARKEAEDARLRTEAGIAPSTPPAPVEPPISMASPPPAAAPPFVGPPNPLLSTDDRMRAEGKTNAVGVPINKAPPAPTETVSTAPAAPSPVASPVRINQATGLPFGYRPGDSVAPAQQGAADASVARQIAADPRMQPGGSMIAGPTVKPITGQVAQMPTPAATPSPVSSPVRPAYQSPIAPGGAFSNDAYAKTATAFQTGTDMQAIRAGTASEATKAKYPALVQKIAEDTAAWSNPKPKAPAPVSRPRFALAR